MAGQSARGLIGVVIGALLIFALGTGFGTWLSEMRDDGGQDRATTSSPRATALPSAAPNPETEALRAERIETLDGGERPAPETTGVLPGTELAPAGDVTVSEDGTVLEGMDIACLRISASNVTVRNSRVKCGADNGAVVIAQGVVNAVLEDVEIDGLGEAGNGIVHNNYTLRRVRIHNVSDGARAGTDVTIENSLIHDLTRAEGSHNDGVQTITGSRVVLRNNTIDVVTGEGDLMNSAYIISPNSSGGPVEDVLVEGNYLNGGNYTLYLGQGGAFPVTGLVIRDNVLGPERRYGILSGPPEGIVWENNTDAEGNEIPVSGDVPGAETDAQR